VSRAVNDLVDFGVKHNIFGALSPEHGDILSLHPDRDFVRGLLPPSWQGVSYDDMLRSPCSPDNSVARELIENITLPTCEYLPHTEALTLLKASGSLSAFASAKVDNILPSALPAFGYELTDVMSEFESKAIGRLYRKFKDLVKIDSVPYSALGPTPDCDLSSLPRLSFFDDIRVLWKGQTGSNPKPDMPSIEDITPGNLQEFVPSVFPLMRRESMVVPIAADKRLWSDSDQELFMKHPGAKELTYKLYIDLGEVPATLGVPPAI